MRTIYALALNPAPNQSSLPGNQLAAQLQGVHDVVQSQHPWQGTALPSFHAGHLIHKYHWHVTFLGADRKNPCLTKKAGWKYVTKFKPKTIRQGAGKHSSSSTRLTVFASQWLHQGNAETFSRRCPGHDPPADGAHEDTSTSVQLRWAESVVAHKPESHCCHM